MEDTTPNLSDNETYIDLSGATPIAEQKKKQPILVYILLAAIILMIVTLGAIFINSQTGLFTNNLAKPEAAKVASSSAMPQKEATGAAKLKKTEVIGFLPSWMVAKEVKVNPANLSQIVFFALSATDSGDLVKFDSEGKPVLEWHYFNSAYFNEVRSQASASGTKVLVTIKNFDNISINNLISNEAAINNFIKQILSLVREYKLDGINIDFEYITSSDFPTAKYLNGFLERVTSELKKESLNNIVSFDVNADAVLRDGAYDMVKIGEIVDWVILMAYDYTRVGSQNAGPVSPLAMENDLYSITKSVESLTGRVPKDKIILAIPFYGYEWQTISDEYLSATVPNSGAMATYNRIRELIDSRSDISLNWDEISLTPWLSYRQSGTIKQIYYEDEQSVKEKIKFMEDNKLGGLGIWALGYEGEYTQLWDEIAKIN